MIPLFLAHAIQNLWWSYFLRCDFRPAWSAQRPWTRFSPETPAGLWRRDPCLHQSIFTIEDLSERFHGIQQATLRVKGPPESLMELQFELSDASFVSYTSITDDGTQDSEGFYDVIFDLSLQELSEEVITRIGIVPNDMEGSSPQTFCFKTLTTSFSSWSMVWLGVSRVERIHFRCC